MNIVLLGATGFIGSHATRQLAEQGHTVTLFHRGQTHAELPDAVRHIHGDRRNLSSYKEAFGAASPDVMVDVMPMSEEEARLVVDTFCGIARRLVAIGSMDVYRVFGQLNGTEDGEPDPRPFDEEGPLRRNMYPYRSHSKQAGDFYDRYDKILVERVVMNEPQLPATVLRLPAVYSPGDKQHRVGGYLRQMDAGEVVLSPSLAQWRWTRGYVEDVGAAIALAATDDRAANRIYNVGEENSLTELEWVRAIAEAARWNGAIKIEDGSDETDYRFPIIADTSRIRRELGYAETVPLPIALERTVEWERANAARKL